MTGEPKRDWRGLPTSSHDSSRDSAVAESYGECRCRPGKRVLAGGMVAADPVIASMTDDRSFLFASTMFQVRDRETGEILQVPPIA